MRRSAPLGDETPLMQQYREIKSQHADAILFFRMGDFYEMFFDDAKIAATELGLTLTARNNGGAGDVPLAGVPVKAADEYLRRLIERGHRVAICEQVQDPKEAKGIVRRAVVETLTPGAIIAKDWLEGTRNNFLVSVFLSDVVGIAAIDLSTGEFLLESVAPEDLEPALARYAPREIVTPDAAAAPYPTDVMATERPQTDFRPEVGVTEITSRFGLQGLEGFGIEDDDREAVGAAGALLRYIAELQPGGLPALARPTMRRAGKTMPLDEMTRRNLELVEPLNPGQRGGTVLDVLDRTVTPMGARLLRGWLMAPLCEIEPIRDRHDALDVLTRDARGRERLREALDGVRDLERLAGRSSGRRGSPRDFAGLRESLHRLPDVLSALDGLHDREGSSLLDEIAGTFELHSELTEHLTRMVVDHPPALLGQADSIRREADQTLDEARDLRDGGKQFIAELQVRERERTGLSTLKVGFNKVFGYYLEISKAHRGDVPAQYERRQTLTNAERYVTPELKEYEAKVLGAEERALERERGLFDLLADAVRQRLAPIQLTARLLASLDVFASLAETATRERYVRPVLDESMALDLRQCRHPVVERALPPGKFISNDIELDESSRVMLLTGPNMAGKSTILRQTGLAVILAQIGSFVPAASARLGVVDRVFTRVGASDNLGKGQSTFMVEMSETSAILHTATTRSVVLLDEIGRGTATYDGVAIAWATTEHLHDRIGCKTIFATHYHELTQLTEELAHARNFNVAVKEIDDDILFLHRLEPGGADRSYGIHVGRLAGLPTSVVTRAGEILRLLESGHHVAGRTVPPPPDPQQLGLFATSEHPMLHDLRALDPNGMTPLEALQWLTEMKKRLEETS